MLTVTVTPVDATAAMRAILEKFATPSRAPLGQALRLTGEEIMLEAKGRTPVDRGWLRASGQVEGPAFEDDGAKVTLSFGDLSVDYAIFVHENLEAHHPVGEAKFLERPVTEWVASGKLERRLGELLSGLYAHELASLARVGGGTRHAPR